MVLAKLRADIEAKRLAYEFAKVATPAELLNMKYWKMKYWKMGSVELPETEQGNPGGKAPQK